MNPDPSTSAQTLAPVPVLSKLSASSRIFSGDRAFFSLIKASTFSIALILTAVTVFLVVQSMPAFFATSDDASILSTNFIAYVLPLVFGTVWVSLLALIIAAPLSVGIAIFGLFYAPRRLRSLFGFFVDLLAAIPSVVYGLWGITVLAPHIRPLYVWLNTHADWLPLFSGPVSGTGRTTLTAALVLAIMVIPIITSLCREVFKQVPENLIEGAYALGATRWEMLTLAVFPYTRSGIFSAIMLGLGRALGETMAIAMVLSATGIVSFNLFTSETPSTIAANIALSFPEAYGININVLIATGLILFLVTLLVNGASRALIRR